MTENMKKTPPCLLALAMIVIGTACSSVPPAKTSSMKTYDIQAFNKIESDVIANVVFVQSNTVRVEASGPDNYIPYIMVSVQDSTLHIAMKKESPKLKNNKLLITVSAPELQSLVCGGVGDVTLKDSVKVKNLTLSSHGVGNLLAEALVGCRIEVSRNGVGNMYLKGKADTAYYTSDGVGNLDASGMIVSDVTIRRDGVGNASCYAARTIDISSGGIGNLHYYGNPDVKAIHKSGIGNVRQQ